jgi:hypothetical protein
MFADLLQIHLQKTVQVTSMNEGASESYQDSSAKNFVMLADCDM